jgi:hypothetical protein
MSKKKRLVLGNEMTLGKRGDFWVMGGSWENVGWWWGHKAMLGRCWGTPGSVKEMLGGMLSNLGKCQRMSREFFVLPQVNGCAYIDFGCTHPIDGLFWNPPIYYLGFFSKYECWITDLIMPLLSFYFFWVVTCIFVSRGFISQWNVKTNSPDWFF